MKIRRAHSSDISGIHALIADYAGQGLLLPRTREEVRADIANFLVAEESGCLAGCVALDPYGATLAEVRSLAVAPHARSNGLGGRLLAAAVREARRRRIARVFAVTHATEFFERHEFRLTAGGIPPEKVGRDCAGCFRASHCRLRAVTLDLAPVRALPPVLSPSHNEPVTV
jgi:amino-acid N-acetyltransferase